MKNTKPKQLESYKQKQYESIGLNAVKIMLLEFYQDKPEVFKTKAKSTLMKFGFDNITAEKIANSSTRNFFLNLK